MKRILLSTLVISILVLSACGGATTTQPTEPEPTEKYEEILTPVDAKEISRLYYTDRDAGDAQYKTKIIHVTGIVHLIASDYIFLETGYTRHQFTLKAELAPGKEEQLTALSVGQEVKVKGTVAGYYYKSLILRDSIIED